MKEQHITNLDAVQQNESESKWKIAAKVNNSVM
jgi:hypothetical protein